MASAINAAAASAGIPAGIGKTVLVTGVTGFVGTEVALAYIQHGFFVHGTARSQDKADAWIKLHPVAGKRIKFFIVKDMIVDGCCEEAMQGVDIVAHTGKSETPTFAAYGLTEIHVHSFSGLYGCQGQGQGDVRAGTLTSPGMGLCS